MALNKTLVHLYFIASHVFLLLLRGRFQFFQAGVTSAHRAERTASFLRKVGRVLLCPDLWPDFFKLSKLKSVYYQKGSDFEVSVSVYWMLDFNMHCYIAFWPGCQRNHWHPIYSLPIFDFVCLVLFLMIHVRCYWDHISKMESRTKASHLSETRTFHRFNMQPEPYSSLGITESVKWNKVNCWLGPLSLYPCLKSLSTPAEFRIHCPETRSNLAAIDPFPNQTQDLLNMLTTLEWVF